VETAAGYHSAPGRKEVEVTMTLPSYATNVWSYFSTFMGWDVVGIVIGMVGLAIGARAVSYLWAIFHKGA
jgi:hypothetical protein